MKQGVEIFLARGLDCHFRFELVQWWTHQFQRPTPTSMIGSQALSPHLELLLELIERGMKGDSIVSPLERLEEDVLRLTKDEIQKEVDLMPLRLMIPALLFFFPGLMCLLIGPILSELLDLLGG